MIRKTPWSYDPNWIRCECLDDRGNSLGCTFFEPREGFTAPDFGTVVRRRNHVRAAAELAVTLLAGSLLMAARLVIGL